MPSDRGCLTFSNEEPSFNDRYDQLLSNEHINTRPLHEFNRKRQTDQYCLNNGQSRASSVFDPLLDFSSTFRQYCTFSLTRLRSPRNRTQLAFIDADLRAALSQFITTSSNTAIVLLSASGHRSDQGLAGIVESKSPLLAAWFPPEFREARNDHYSTFAWNMDKLITTRDVRATLQQLANGSVPEIVEWPAWDLEHEQASSLLGEMLPEERNCSTLHIPAENCMCLGSNKQRNATVQTDDDLLQRVLDVIEQKANEQPCVDGIELAKRYSYLNAHRMFEKEESDEADDVEWLTISFYAKIRKEKQMHGGNYGGSQNQSRVWFKATVRHHISSGRLEYVEALITSSYECFAVNLETLCSVCYSSPLWLLSSPQGPNKGFLLDTASAIV